MAGTYNFKIDQRADSSLVLIYEDKNGLIDLTGKTAAMQLRDGIKSEEAIDTLTTANSRIVFEETTKDGETKLSKIRCKFPNGITKEFNFNNCVYDLKIITDLGGGEIHIKRLLEGTITLKPASTRIVS